MIRLVTTNPTKQVLSHPAPMTRHASKNAIETPEQLARELAWRAQQLKASALDGLFREIGQEKGPLYRLFQDINQVLSPQEPDVFADMFAQTIAYVLFAARWYARNEQERFTAKMALHVLPQTSEFLRDLFHRLINEDYEPNRVRILCDNDPDNSHRAGRGRCTQRLYSPLCSQ